MSRISTERRRSADAASFRRTLTSLVVVLALLCGTFFALDWFQGPKLTGGAVDTAAVAETPGQQLRLFVNQPVGSVSAEQVTVTPAVPVTVSTSGSIIAVQFSEALHYATEYRVTVAEVVGAQRAAASTLDYRFTTDSATVYYLERADPARGGKDSIIRTGIGSSPDEVAKDVVYSADRIQEFTVVGNALAVVTMAEDHTGTVTLVSIENGSTERLVLPEAGQVQELHGSPDAGMIGFVLNGSAGGALDTLMLVDLNGSHAVVPAMALDGSPLSVLNWRFLPGTSQYVAQSYDQTLLLADAAAPTTPIPIGTWGEFDDVSPDGSAILVKDTFGSLMVSLLDGTETRLTPSAVDGEQPYSSAPAFMPDGRIRIQSVVLTTDFKSFQNCLVLDDGTTATVVFRPDALAAIDSFTVSPNGQYVAIAVVPDVGSSTSDGYYPHAKATSITTFVVDIATGEQVRSYAGFGTSWL